MSMLVMVPLRAYALGLVAGLALAAMALTLAGR